MPHPRQEERALIQSTLAKLLADHCQPPVVEAAEQGIWPEKLWQALQQTGLTQAGISPGYGGAGGEPADALLVLREAAKHAAPVPLAEHLMAALILQEAGEPLTAPTATVAAQGSFQLKADKLTGAADNVAFARWCTHILIPAATPKGMRLCLVPRAALALTEGMSIAGEPRDSIQAKAAKPAQTYPAPKDIEERLQLLGAATRAAMMSGALESILQLSVAYAQERIQFGRPLARFQAIQQQLAILASETAAATMAAQHLEANFHPLSELEVAIAKSRIGEAVSQATDIAHQVHGAMGYTQEHPLNHRTRRLWSWRDDYAPEPHWQSRLARTLTQQGPEALWQRITSI